MQQKWWLIAAGIVGLGLAILLMPRPDTGESLEVDPTNVAPLNFDGDAVAKDPRNVGTTRERPGQPSQLRVARRDIVPVSERRGPNPVAAAQLEARNTPDAIYAGRVSGPLAGARRQLMQMADDEEAAVLAEELAQLILDLRALRRDPDQHEWAPLETRTQSFLDTANGRSDWMEDQILSSVVTSVEKLLVDHTEAANKPPEE